MVVELSIGVLIIAVAGYVFGQIRSRKNLLQENSNR